MEKIDLIKGLIEDLKSSNQYQKDESFKLKTDLFLEEIEFSDELDNVQQENFYELVSSIDSKEMLPVVKEFNKMFPDMAVKFDNAELQEGLLSLNEDDSEENPEGEENAEETDDESSLENPEGEENAEESDDEETDEEKEVQKTNLLSDLEQIDTNIDRIKDLESEEELKEIYLKELGKKYVVEEKLKELGHKFEDVGQETISDIFESKKIDNNVYFNYKKSLSNFKKKVCSLDESRKIFSRVVLNNSMKILNESLNLILEENGIQYSIYSKDGIDDKLFMKPSSDIPEDVLKLFTKVDDFYIFDKDSLEDVISFIKNTASNGDDKIMIEVDGNYLNTNEGEDFDLVDQEEGEEFESLEEAEKNLQFINENYNWRGKIVKFSRGSEGDSKISDISESGRHFVLKKDFSFGGVNISKGTPALLYESKAGKNKFKSLNLLGNEILVSNELFESCLEPVSSSEYRISLSESLIKFSGFGKYKKLFENKGFKLELKSKSKSGKKYKSFVLLSESEEIELVNEEIGDLDFSDENNLEPEEILSSEEAISSYDENENLISEVFDKALDGDYQTVNVGDDFDYDEDLDLEDGEEYKISDDVYVDDDGNVDNDEQKELLFESNMVVRFFENKGFTIDNERFFNVPNKFIRKFNKFNIDNLAENKSYVLSDLKESRKVVFIDKHDVNGSSLFEFKDLGSGEEYYLNSKEVVYNLK